tara:strand:+ start:302 stop:520 length:219 start_codon:yes stop_codon:yes gene_type:complete
MGINLEVFPRKGEDPKRTIKRFIKKCKREGFLREVVERRYFKKPSEIRRINKKKKERTVQKLREEEEKKYRD